MVLSLSLQNKRNKLSTVQIFKGKVKMVLRNRSPERTQKLK
jgi:hypothetical protein